MSPVRRQGFDSLVHNAMRLTWWSIKRDGQLVHLPPDEIHLNRSYWRKNGFSSRFSSSLTISRCGFVAVAVLTCNTGWGRPFLTLHHYPIDHFNGASVLDGRLRSTVFPTGWLGLDCAALHHFLSWSGLRRVKRTADLWIRSCLESGPARQVTPWNQALVKFTMRNVKKQLMIPIQNSVDRSVMNSKSNGFALLSHHRLHTDYIVILLLIFRINF